MQVKFNFFLITKRDVAFEKRALKLKKKCKYNDNALFHHQEIYIMYLQRMYINRQNIS